MARLNYPKFLDNQPAGIDLFESGSQQRTAKSIVFHIKNKATRIKLIGLEGTWGSGKSNVISIIQKELGESYHLFIYDSWSHQVDLQRRSFLEELTDDLQSNDILDKAKWKGKLNSLLAKKKESITRSIPKVSLAIIVSFLVAVVTPVTTSLSTLLPDKSPWKIPIAMAPIIIAAIAWGIAAFKKKKYRNFSNLFYLYKERELEQRTEETISEKEPSIREFRNWLTELSTEAKKEIVIVFDNMDRLQEDKIQTLWSSIHTFFSDQPYENLWVIVPFDRKHIIEAFTNGSDLEKGRNFINKTFSVIFSVSPPVLTDWRSFFKSKFKEAFSETEDTEYNLVKNIYDIHNTIITPRGIIAFINDLIALKLVWNTEIPLRYMAIFLLNKEKILSDPLNNILNKSFLEKSPSYFKEDDFIVDSMAALVYNVPLNNAAQVTLTREILVRIRNEDIEKITELANGTNFFELLEVVIQKEEIEIDHLIATLNGMEKNTTVGEESKEILKDIWNNIITRYLSNPIDSFSFSNSHQAILLHATNDQVKKVFTVILSVFRNSKQFNSVGYYKNVQSMENFIESNKLTLDLYALLEPKEVAPEDFFNLVKETGENYSIPEITCDDDLFEKYLIDNLPTNIAEYSILEVLPQTQFPNLRNKIAESINTNLSLTALDATFDAYKAISDRPLTKKLDDQTIYNLLSSATKNSKAYYDLVAMRVAKADQFPAYGGIEQSILQETDPELAKNVAERIEWYSDYGEILLKSISLTPPLYRLVAKDLTISPKSGVSRLNVNTIYPKFLTLATAISVTPDELLTSLDRWIPILKNKIKAENIKNVIPDKAFFTAISENKTKSAQYLLNTVKEYLYSLSPDQLASKLLEPGSFELSILNTLIKNGIVGDLPDSIVTGYQKSLIDIAENDITLDNDALFIFPLIYTRINKHLLVSTAKDVRDVFLNGISISPEKFIFFENLLRNEGDLNEKAPDVSRKILNKVMENEMAFTVILSNPSFYSEIINNAKDDAFDFIRFFRKQSESRPADSSLREFGDIITKMIAKRISIISANITGNDKRIDITKRIRKIVENEGQTHFLLDENFFQLKDKEIKSEIQLDIEYNFDSEKLSKSFKKDDWLNLP